MQASTARPYLPVAHLSRRRHELPADTHLAMGPNQREVGRGQPVLGTLWANTVCCHLRHPVNLAPVAAHLSDGRNRSTFQKSQVTPFLR